MPCTAKHIAHFARWPDQLIISHEPYDRVLLRMLLKTLYGLMYIVHYFTFVLFVLKAINIIIIIIIRIIIIRIIIIIIIY